MLRLVLKHIVDEVTDSLATALLHSTLLQTSSLPAMVKPLITVDGFCHQHVYILRHHMKHNQPKLLCAASKCLTLLESRRELNQVQQHIILIPRI